jgi:hypothetical protein
MDRACRKHGEKLYAYRVLVRKPEENRPLGRPRCKWEQILRWISEK